MLYRVKDWDEHYENNRTRDLKKMAWVPVPNNHDGDGITVLLDHENGASHFGAWNMIIQVASKCRPRGTLLRGGGIRHDSGSLSRMTRIPKEIYDEVLPRLLSPEIGWLEAVEDDGVTTIPQEGAVIPHVDAAIPQEPARNGTEGNGKNTTPPTPPSGDSKDRPESKPKERKRKRGGVEAQEKQINDPNQPWLKNLKPAQLTELNDYPLERQQEAWRYTQKVLDSGQMIHSTGGYFLAALRDGRRTAKVSKSWIPCPAYCAFGTDRESDQPCRRCSSSGNAGHVLVAPGKMLELAQERERNRLRIENNSAQEAEESEDQDFDAFASDEETV